MSNVRSLAFCNYVVWKDIQWFWSANFNALFSRNLVSGEVKRWGNYIKHNKKGNGTAYSNVVLYHDKIIAIPGRERKILIFDLETESFRYIDLKMGFTKEDQNVFFAYAVSDKRLFMIGNEIPYILDFDMESEKILGIVNLGVHIKGRQAYFRDAVLDKDKLIVPLLDENLDRLASDLPFCSGTVKTAELQPVKLKKKVSGIFPEKIIFTPGILLERGFGYFRSRGTWCFPLMRKRGNW